VIVIRLKRVAGLVVALLMLFADTVLAAPAKVLINTPLSSYVVNSNGLVVFDEQGKEIFKTSERIISASLAGDLLVYKTVKSQKNYVVRLP
jgi:hypothetical protein